MFLWGGYASELQQGRTKLFMLFTYYRETQHSVYLPRRGRAIKPKHWCTSASIHSPYKDAKPISEDA